MKPLLESVQYTSLGHAIPKPIFHQAAPSMSFPLFYLRHTRGTKLDIVHCYVTSQRFLSCS